MRLEQQVVSLERAKRLKELGVKQESHFSWFQEKKEQTYQGWSYQKDVPWLLMGTHHAEVSTNKNRFEHVIAAFTVAELGEMLYDIFDRKNWDLLYKAYGEVFDFKGTQRIGEIGIVNLMRRPDMAAKMLIYLLEKNLCK